MEQTKAIELAHDYMQTFHTWNAMYLWLKNDLEIIEHLYSVHINERPSFISCIEGIKNDADRDVGCFNVNFKKR